MTPINRIPQMDSETSLAQIVSAELRNRSVIPLAQQLEAAFCHDQSEDGLSCMLDWAMQIRSEFGISWSESIDAAMTLFYG